MKDQGIIILLITFFPSLSFFLSLHFILSLRFGDFYSVSVAVLNTTIFNKSNDGNNNNDIAIFTFA